MHPTVRSPFHKDFHAERPRPWLYLVSIGTAVFALVAGLILVTDFFLQKRHNASRAVQTLYSTKLILDNTLQENESWAKTLAGRIMEEERKKLPDIYLSAAMLSADKFINFFDASANPIEVHKSSAASTASSINLPQHAGPILASALQGSVSSGFTMFQGQPALTACAPVSHAVIKAVTVTVPLGRFALSTIKPLVDADLAIFAAKDLHTLSQFHELDPKERIIPFPLWKTFFSEVSSVGGATSLKNEEEYGAGQAAMAKIIAADGTLLGYFAAVPLRQSVFFLPLSIVSVFSALVSLLVMGLVAFFHKIPGKRIVVETLPDGNTPFFSDTPTKETPLSLPQHLAPAAPQATIFSSEEVKLILQEALEQNSSAQKTEYQRFFDYSPTGIFQITASGGIIRVNQALAEMLGYDSAVHLQTERPSLGNLCAVPEELPALLSRLRDYPDAFHEVILHNREELPKPMWINSIPNPDPSVAACIEGFLLDRSEAFLVEQIQEKIEKTILKTTSLALLLASVTDQSRSYFAKSVDQNTSTQPDVRQFQSDKQTHEALQSILDDIHAIAVSEADTSSSITTAINLLQLISQLQRQACPAMQDKGIALRSIVANNLTVNVYGSAPLLRHILLRALFFVTGTARGGHAYFSVDTPPDAGPTPGMSNFIFSVSWEADSSAAASRSNGTGGAEKAFIHSALGRAEELCVIRYLAQKAAAEVHEGAQTPQTYSLHISMRLAHAVSQDDGMITDHLAAAPAHQSEQPVLAYDDNVILSGGADLVIDSEDSILFGNSAPSASAASSLENLCGIEDGESQDAGNHLEVLHISDAPQDEKSKPLEILLVEDSLEGRLIFSRYLQHTNHTITEAYDGQQGVELFRQKHFDVVFMDMEMPIMDGYQATRIMRALEADNYWTPTPIIAQTGHVLPEFQKQCFLAGCTGFLPKPFSRNALLNILQKIVDEKQQRENTPYSYSAD